MPKAVSCASNISLGTGSPAGLDSAATASASSANSTEQLPRFNKSGRVEPAPGIKVTATHAEHSSTYVWRNGATGTAEEFAKAMAGSPVKLIVPNPGEKAEF
jgi:hypothetical protein